MLTGNTPSGISGAPETVGRRTSSARNSLALWLAVTGVSLLFLPLFLTMQTIRGDNLSLEAALNQVQTEAASVPTLPAEARHLQATATAVQAQINQLGPIHRQLVAGHVDWQGILATVADYDDTQMVVTGITQTEDRLVITGRAGNDTGVDAYAKSLENSDHFSRVVIQSISQLAVSTQLATPAATPTRASTPGTFPPIFLKQPLLQTFETAQTVNTAIFLAKADRFYEVSTLNLASGVDTALTVSLESGPTYANDDDRPGTLASKVAFQAPASNTQVSIRVTNLGQAGPEMSYQLLVQEIVPKTPAGLATGTPVSSSTPVATPTAIPSATPTTIPTASPTATLPPPPTLAATGGTVAFAILVEIKPQTP